MTDSKGLITSMSKKWKIEQIPTKKLEIENKLMEERLNQLKNEFMHEKAKRSAHGTIWAAAQPGPMVNYAKKIDENLSFKQSNRQVKLQILKDEMIATRSEKSNSGGSNVRNESKKNKCGQCEKNLAFTHCVECGEDYCANCFTSFHIKGALQKHRTLPISKEHSARVNKISSEHHNQNLEEEMYLLARDGSNPYENGSSYRSINSAESGQNHSAQPRKSNPLAEGVYDEREAQAAFQQALLEWRNGGSSAKSNSKRQTSAALINRMMPNQDSNVGTDTSDLGGGVKKGQNKTIQELEKAINSSHSLSYAERMLLQKMRRNELDVNINSGRNQQFKSQFISESNSHIVVEEIENSINLKKQEKLVLLEPDMIDTGGESLTFSKSMKLERENTIKDRPKSSRPKSSSAKSSLTSSTSFKNAASTATVADSKPTVESVIYRQPSNPLKKIAERHVKDSLIISDDLKMGEFFKLNVEDVREEVTMSKSNLRTPSATSIASFTSGVAATNAPVKSSVENFKLSNKFYSMSPRSWVPSNSISLEPKNAAEKEPVSQSTSQTNLRSSLSSANGSKKDTANSPVKKVTLVEDRTKQLKASVEKSKDPVVQKEPSNLQNSVSKSKNEPLAKPKTPTPILKKDTPLLSSKKPVEIAPSDKLKPTVSASLDTKALNNKPVSTNPQKNFGRNKSFVSPTKTKSSVEQPRRAASSAGSYVNRLNLSLATEFLTYDEDDGRSSRVCQNQEDMDYYRTLETEFTKSSGTFGVKDASKEKPIDVDLKVLNEMMTKSLNEFSIKNDDFDDNNGDDLELTLQELKSLR